jgi:GNAT superfamily N-acetyltransferase
VLRFRYDRFDKENLVTLELRRPSPDDYDALGDILHEAFTVLADRHGVVSDFPTPESGRRLQHGRNGREDVYAIAAYLDGVPVGSNFMTLYDEVAGIGPISVAPAAQGHGAGRALMKSALEHARRLGIERVRLMQDAFNTTSLPLYASLGFEVRHPCALVELSAPTGVPSSAVRPVVHSDLQAIESLGRELYGVSRRDEIAIASRGDARPMLLERNGVVEAYGGDGWHCVARTVDDAMTLVAALAHHAASGRVHYFVPLTQHELFRASIAAGGVMNLMSIGPYEEPRGVWMPSFLY